MLCKHCHFVDMNVFIIFHDEWFLVICVYIKCFVSQGIREALLEDEEQSCPQCNEVESPDALLPDIILRNAISTFLNKTKSGFRRTLKPKKPAGGSSPAQLATSTASPSHPGTSLAM